MLSPVIDVRTAQRSLVATLEVTALASGAHLVAGGELPAPGFLLALGAVVFACSLATIGRLARIATVIPLVLGAQVGLHAAFTSAEPMHAMPGMAAPAPGLWHLEPTMFWAHLVTSVVTAIILLSQERALAAVVSWLKPIAVVAAPVPLVARRSFAVVVRGRRSSLLRTSPRRGPPVLLARSA